MSPTGYEKKFFVPRKYYVVFVIPLTDGMSCDFFSGRENRSR